MTGQDRNDVPLGVDVGQVLKGKGWPSSAPVVETASATAASDFQIGELADKAFQLARQSFQNRQYGLALNTLRSLLPAQPSGSPRHRDILVSIIACMRATGGAPEAIERASQLETVLYRPQSTRDPQPTRSGATEAEIRPAIGAAWQMAMARAYPEAIAGLHAAAGRSKPGTALHCDALSRLVRCMLMAGHDLVDTLITSQTCVTLYPRDPVSQLTHARCCLRLDSNLHAFIGFKKAARYGANQSECAWGAIQALLRRKRFALALAIYDATDFGAKGFSSLPLLIAEAKLATKQVKSAIEDIDGILSTGRNDGRTQLYRAVARSLRAHLALPDRSVKSRHIAIGGTSYVGSSIFGVILGSIEGAENIGEANWLINLKRNDLSTAIDFDNDPPRTWPVCKVHRQTTESCFSAAFRRSLASDPTNFYDKVAAHLGAPILVTSDKTLANYWVLDPLARFDLIILYRSPLVQMRSNIKNLLRKSSEVGKSRATNYDFSHHLTLWSRSYMALLHNLQPSGRRLVLNWECFVDKPTEHLKAICRQLDLPFRQDLLETITVKHLFGGNESIRLDSIVGTGSIQLRPSAQPELTAAQEAEILSHHAAGLVFRFLESHYRRAFAGCL